MAETPPNLPPDEGSLEDSGAFSNFFNDVKWAWERVGTPLVWAVAIGAIAFFGYRMVSLRAEASKQTAWLDLYGATSPESRELAIDATNSPSVRATAHLRAGDLLLEEANTAAEADAADILAAVAGHYEQAIAEAPHPIYALNALDGLGVVAEARHDTEAARSRYEAVRERATPDFPYWIDLADKRLAMLPRLAEPVEFAPEPEPEPLPEGDVPSEAPAEPGEATAPAEPAE
ncbi:MAG: hypothetical protein AAF710_04255 [Planctomycetota bacterium]